MFQNVLLKQQTSIFLRREKVWARYFAFDRCIFWDLFISVEKKNRQIQRVTEIVTSSRLPTHIRYVIFMFLLERR